MRLAAKPIAYLGGAVVFLGLVYLGATLREGYGGGPALSAVAMVAAGAILTGFAVIYGFSGF